MNRYPVSVAVALTLAITGGVSAGASAYSPDVDPAITNGKASREFKEARAKWLSRGISRYRFVITPTCYCVSIKPVRIAVRGRRVRTSNPRWFGPRTIPGVYKVIHDAIHRDAARLDTTYSRSRGLPRRVAIDYSRRIADEEITYRVKRFRKIRRAVR